MDAVAAGKAHRSAPNFEEKSLIRAERHEHLRGRRNATSCRSPPREVDTKSMKNELKEKRQLEFLRRRPVGPEMCGSKSAERQSKKRAPSRMLQMWRHSSEADTSESRPAANGRPVVILERSLSESPDSRKWDRTRASETQDSNVHKEKKTVRMRTARSAQQIVTRQHELAQVKTLREAGVQTESGSVTVRESDLQKLADYLQEALWREEILKTKLASLQDSTADLMNDSDKIWTSRCCEDLLRNKIRALEAQLQLCLQKVPKDAVKTLLLQMERQKLGYEDRAVIALQKATHEKTEAVTQAETLKVALSTALAESQRWQGLCEDLQRSSEQLRRKQDQSNDQLQQLRDTLELSRAREGQLTEELVSLKAHNQDLQYNIRLLEEDNYALQEELQLLREGGDETEDLLMQQVYTSQEAEQGPRNKRSLEVEEQLQQTLATLQMKEKECEELRTELSAMEQECQSTQRRLSQCREQLRQITHRPRTRAGGCRWLGLCLFLMVLLALCAAAGMLWMWYPPFREQLQDLYSDLHTRIEDYLIEMSSPQNSGCFRPV